ncbi:MAG: tyrosine recombinase [Firmicutes bacterium]|nr:tyrosine recombinase [Bacillota bacterium]
MESILAEFEAYLFQEKKMARNSLQAYRRDVRGFAGFLKEKNIHRFSDASSATVISYVLYLKKIGRTTSTINRKVASVRSFYNFLIRRGDVTENPAEQIRTPKQERKALEYLSPEEVELLLAQPDGSRKGIRDKAILELIYATGMRVSELVMLDVGDVNLKMDFVACGSEQGSGRIIPIGRLCKEALIAYLETDRASMLTDPSEQALFINYTGHRLTRQGLWKIIRHYADKAGIRKRITPQILRHSFAVHMLQNGADLKSLQELLGHEEAAATQVYLTAEKENLKEVYAKAHPRA